SAPHSYGSRSSSARSSAAATAAATATTTTTRHVSWPPLPPRRPVGTDRIAMTPACDSSDAALLDVESAAACGVEQPDYGGPVDLAPQMTDMYVYGVARHVIDLTPQLLLDLRARHDLPGAPHQ